MRRHPPDLRNTVRVERKLGLGIDELAKKYSLPRTTVWHYVHDIILSENLRRKLRSRQGGTHKRTKEHWLKAENEAKQLLSVVDVKSSWPVLLTALYWSEGTKKGGFVFTNTDPEMIKIFLDLLRNKLNVKDPDFDIMIRTCIPMNPADCKKYWSEITQIHEKSLKINHNDAQNKSKTKFGMCRITVRKGGYILKLMHCLIRALVAKMLDEAPVAQWTEHRTPNAAMQVRFPPGALV